MTTMSVVAALKEVEIGVVMHDYPFTGLDGNDAGATSQPNKSSMSSP